jgi:hypothetical protein
MPLVCNTGNTFHSHRGNTSGQADGQVAPERVAGIARRREDGEIQLNCASDETWRTTCGLTE